MRNFLNKLIWDNNPDYNLDNYEIIYTHRGVSGDNLIVNCAEIIKVNSDSFEYHDKFINEIKRIPFHRIERIWEKKSNKTIYQKITRGN